MALDLIKRNWKNNITEITIGATEAEGGTRNSVVTVGGETTLPFLHFEGKINNRPVVALEVSDIPPTNWPEKLARTYGDLMQDPVSWAQECEKLGADLIYLTLDSANPAGKNRSGEEVAQTVSDVLETVELPLIIVGCDEEEKDNEIMRHVAEASRGEKCLLGIAVEDNYNSIVGSCMLGDHNVIAQSPIDVNICKQLNIMITEMGMARERIVIDPVVSSLGYGMEYSYSVMERIRTGGLSGDNMLAMPMICTVGAEAWRVKEAYVEQDEFPAWGPQHDRGILWETMTATSYLQAGANIVVLRHPEAVKHVRKNIDDLMQY